jgi:hypothetical protein
MPDLTEAQKLEQARRLKKLAWEIRQNNPTAKPTLQWKQVHNPDALIAALKRRENA